MTKVKMTIHRGLSELKTLDDRIAKATENVKPSGIVQKGKKVYGLYDKAEFEKDAKADLQSVNDLIKRKSTIKAAIVESNSKTKVKIGDVEMTVADAITEKENIVLKKNLLNSLEEKHNKAVGNLNTSNEKVENGADAAARFTMNPDNQQNQTKIEGEAALNVRKQFIDMNQYELVDPIGIEKYLKEEREKIAIFEMEVDAVLSESNAVTFIFED